MPNIRDFNINNLLTDPRFQGSNLQFLQNGINKDNNGIFSQQELLSWDIGGYQNPMAGKPDADFDGDGNVTLEELATALQFKDGKPDFTIDQLKQAFKAAGRPDTEPTEAQINLCRARGPNGAFNPNGELEPSRISFMLSKDPADKMRLLSPPPPANINFTDHGTQVDLGIIAGITPDLARVLGAANRDLNPSDNFMTPATLQAFMAGTPLDRAALIKDGLKKGAAANLQPPLSLKPEDVQAQLGLSNEQMAGIFGTPPQISPENLDKFIKSLNPQTPIAERLALFAKAPGSPVNGVEIYTKASVASILGPDVATMLDKLDGNEDQVVAGPWLQSYLEAPTPEAKALFLITPGPNKAQLELSPAQLQKMGIEIPESVLKKLAKDPSKTGPGDLLESTKLADYLNVRVEINKAGPGGPSNQIPARAGLLKALFPNAFDTSGNPKVGVPEAVVSLDNLGSLLGLPPEVVALIDATDIGGNPAFATDGYATIGAVMALTTGEPKDRLTYLATGQGANRPISQTAAKWILGRDLSPDEVSASRNLDGSIDPQRLLAKAFPGTPSNTTTTNSTGGVAPAGTAADIILAGGPRGADGSNNTYLANAGFFNGGKVVLPNFSPNAAAGIGFPLTQTALKEAGYLSFSGDNTVDEFEVAMQALATRGNNNGVPAKPITISQDNLKVLLHLPPSHTFTPEELACLKGNPPAANGELSLSAVAKMYNGTPDQKIEVLEAAKNQPGFNVTKTLAQAFGLSEANVNKVMAIAETDKAGRLAKLEELLRNPTAP